jgi:hypothetical protein
VHPIGQPRIVNDKHLSLCIGQGSSCRRAIYFNGARAPLPSPPWDVAVRIRADNFGAGPTLVELQVEALREAGPIEWQAIVQG